MQEERRKQRKGSRKKMKEACSPFIICSAEIDGPLMSHFVCAAKIHFEQCSQAQAIGKPHVIGIAVQW